MFVTPALYITLGFSLGVGLTVIYLQEKFVKERRRLAALIDGEQAKSAQMLKELDAKWEEESSVRDQELAEAGQRIGELEASLHEAGESNADQEQVAALHETLANREQELRTMAEQNQALEQRLAEQKEVLDSQSLNDNSAQELTEARQETEKAGQEISELHGQLEFLKGEIERLEGEKAGLARQEKKAAPADEDIIFTTGNHVMPASVAKALMGNKKGFKY